MKNLLFGLFISLCANSYAQDYEKQDFEKIDEAYKTFFDETTREINKENIKNKLLSGDDGKPLLGEENIKDRLRELENFAARKIRTYKEVYDKKNVKANKIVGKIISLLKNKSSTNEFLEELINDLAKLYEEMYVTPETAHEKMKPGYLPNENQA